MSDSSDPSESGGATGSTDPTSGKPRRKPRGITITRRQGIAIGVAAVFLVFAGMTARLFVWPDLPPLPDRADAIVQLGGPGDRRALTLELVRQGRAPIAAISVDDQEAGTTWCRRGSLDGVPVVCFHPDPSNTRGEARFLAELARQQGWRSVILVTSPDQAWRANVRVGRCYDGAVAVATTPLPAGRWPQQIVHQWVATAKAFTYELGC